MVSKPTSGPTPYMSNSSIAKAAKGCEITPPPSVTTTNTTSWCAMWSDASGVDPGFIAAAVSGILPDGFAAIFKGIPNLRGRLHPAEGQVIVVAAVPVSALTTRWPIDATNNNVVYPEADDGALHSNGPANITATFPGTHLPTRRALQTVLLQMIKMEGTTTTTTSSTSTSTSTSRTCVHVLRALPTDFVRPSAWTAAVGQQ